MSILQNIKVDYFDSMQKIYILIIVSAIAFITIFIISYFANHKDLSMIKNKETGDGQMGTDHFASKKEIENTYLTIPYMPKLWREGKKLESLKPGIIVGYNKHSSSYSALVDTGDVHALMIGASGIGKTTYFLYPNIEYALACGVSFLSTDTKGDIYRNVSEIAEKNYGYNISILDLRNPSHSHGNNFMYLVNRYMDLYKEHPNNISYKAKAEKYAKIISKTIIYSGNSDNIYGQNSFFYDSAEGLLTACILLVSEFCPDEERHIVSVFKIIRELMSPEENEDYSTYLSSNHVSKKKRKKMGFKELLELLPDTHKAKWLASAAVSSSEQSVANVLSTALSRLNAFLDSELEHIICNNTNIDAEKFVNEKSAIFIVLPEEDNTKHFLASLFTVQLYRELLSIADEHGGRLKNKVLFLLDEFGTIPKIQSVDMMFSASRSRNISIVAIIQSYAQLQDNYGKNKAEIIKNYGEIPPIKCYPNMLNQVFMNILINASQAIEGEGKITIDTNFRSGNLIVKIKDTGCGIKEPKKIFDLGYTTKGVGVGTGMGLAISQKIIEKHKGKISVKTKINEGSEFTITIPGE